ncbi:MAG: hypothetical protein RR203_07655 [Synergistaceae bacterium]
MNAQEKIAYLKGIIDGQNLTDTPDKEKFYKALIAAMESLAEAFEEHEEVHQELNDYLEQLDEDVCAIEDEIDELFDEDDCCDCGCEDYDDDDEDDDDAEYASVLCPECGKDFYIEPDMYEDGEDLVCPHCGKTFTFPD